MAAFHSIIYGRFWVITKEQCFRFNNRATKDNPLNDSDRFYMAMSQASGKRLTYKEVTGKVEETQAQTFGRETREARFFLGGRFAAFSASSLALTSECGTATSRRIKSVNLSKSPVTFFAGRLGLFGTHAPRLERTVDVRLESTCTMDQ
jgi:hypothetical protein